MLVVGRGELGETESHQNDAQIDVHDFAPPQQCKSTQNCSPESHPAGAASAGTDSAVAHLKETSKSANGRIQPVSLAVRQAPSSLSRPANQRRPIAQPNWLCDIAEIQLAQVDVSPVIQSGQNSSQNDIKPVGFATPQQSKSQQNCPESQAGAATQLSKHVALHSRSPQRSATHTPTVIREKLPSEYTREENIAFFHVLARREAERRAREAAALFNYDDDEDPGWDDELRLARPPPPPPPPFLNGSVAAGL